MSLLEDYFHTMNEHHVWDFKRGDTIRVIAGKYGGAIGTVSDTWTGDNSDSVLVMFNSSDEESPGDIYLNFTPDSIELYSGEE